MTLEFSTLGLFKRVTMDFWKNRIIENKLGDSRLVFGTKMVEFMFAYKIYGFNTGSSKTVLGILNKTKQN